jgi:apolipoprotein D and lipocalin family protein
MFGLVLSALFSLSAIGSVFANNYTTVPELDVNRYIGHWYQVYASPFDFTFQGYGKCITADYGILGNNNVSVLNSQYSKEDAFEQIAGYAFYKDLSEPGQLSVHLDGVPTIAPYWVVKLGEDLSLEEYSYSIIAVPTGPSLWVLARNVADFFERDDAEVREFLDLYNLIYVKVEQEDCPTYL